MPSIDFILKQLKSVRSTIAPRAVNNNNIHYQTCLMVNNLRVELMAVLPRELRDYIDNSVQPLKAGNGSPPYPENGQHALLVCDLLIDACNEFISEQNDNSPKKSETPVNAPQVPSKAVFIVHGHDEVNLLKFQRLMEKRWNIGARVLREQPSSGKTVIEKFEQFARECGYAFILMTPDDQVSTTAGATFQARPNVIFELGWFYGRLGRDRVCLLYKTGTTIHSDLAGVIRIEFRDNIEEKIGEIESELRAARLI